MLKQSATNSQLQTANLVRISIARPASAERQDDEPRDVTCESSSVSTQADDLIDLTTMAFLERLEHLVETEASLDRQIEQLENYRQTLLNQPAKVLLVHPILLKDKLEDEQDVPASTPDSVKEKT